MPFFWIVLDFRGKQTFKMLHKSMKCYGVHHLVHHDLQVNFQGDLKVKTSFLKLNSVPGQIFL